MGETAALILSKKTRILPGHVDQLERTIDAVRKFSPRLAELREFREKELYGKAVAKCEAQTSGCTITRLLGTKRVGLSPYLTTSALGKLGCLSRGES